MMIRLFLALLLALAVLQLALVLANNFAFTRGAWRVSRALARWAPYLFGPRLGGSMAFHAEAFALREEGRVAEATTFVKARLLSPDVLALDRNAAIDVLISAGAYRAALEAEPRPNLPRDAREALGFALIQINLAEADYNLGRWDAAEARLQPLHLASWRFPICRAGLLQQRAWIAAHRGRAGEALELCAATKPRWLPFVFRAEYHFTRMAALLAAGRVDESEGALSEGERVARRLSSRRNAIFLRARIAEARGDWTKVESLCREAAGHAWRGQGGAGLLLWAEALKRLDRHPEADEALRLVSERDPESDAARVAAELLGAVPLSGLEAGA